MKLAHSVVTLIEVSNKTNKRNIITIRVGNIRLGIDKILTSWINVLLYRQAWSRVNAGAMLCKYMIETTLSV